MDIPDHIRNAVYAGQVLDDDGKWKPLDQVLAKEKEFLKHLENGDVLVDDRWVPLALAREQQNQRSPG